MKKMSYEYILFYLQILFIALFVLVLLAYTLDMSEKDFFERRMYSENVQGIQLGDSAKDEDVALAIPNLDNTDFMIYRYLVDDMEIQRGVYGTSDIFKYSDYIAEGRFFSNEDYNEKSKTVVMGQNILSQTIEENGKRYYGYDQQLYEVIGVFKDTGTVLDDTIYFNLPSLLESEDNMGLYYVDAKDSESVQKVLSAMQKNAGSSYSTMLVAYESNADYIGLNRTSKALLVFAVFAALCNLFITVIFFVTHKKYKVAIQKLCGMTSKDLALLYGKDIMLIVLLSFLSVLLIINVLSKYLGLFFTLDKLASYHFLITGIILLLLGVVTIYCVMRLAKGVNISDSLKDR